MKFNFGFQIYTVMFFTLFPIAHLVKADDLLSTPQNDLILKCQEAIRMNCQDVYDYSDAFVFEAENPQIKPESCISSPPELVLSEYWLDIQLSGADSYFLDAYGVNWGIEIYTGSCENLEMIDCVNATDDDTFLEFSPPLYDQYFVRLIGFKDDGDSGFEVYLNCYTPLPACSISIDSVEVGACINESGMVNVMMWGTLNPEPELPLFYAEVETDLGYYTFSGEAVDGFWEASFDVSGSTLYFLAVYAGNSENGCGDFHSEMALPTYLCNNVKRGTLDGRIDWKDDYCEGLTIAFKLFVPNTATALLEYHLDGTESGAFQIDSIPVGHYDLIIDIQGFLPKGFQDLEIGLYTNLLDGGSFNQGDLNSDGIIDDDDINMLIPMINTPLPQDHSLNYLDQNCDGFITMFDLSALMANFGLIGDSAPLGN